MTLEEVRLPNAMYASHDPHWHFIFNRSVRQSVGLPEPLYESRLAQDPNPLISSGKSQKVKLDQKTAFFGEFTVALPVIWLPTGARDIECGLVFDHKLLWTGNHSFGILLGPLPVRNGPYGVGKLVNSGSSSGFNRIAGIISTILCKNCE